MADFDEAFNSKFENINKVINHNDTIDCFFTQRKVTEFEEYLDKNMNRKKKKKDITYNFMAINLPYYTYINSSSNSIKIDLKIWGDENFKYTGTLSSSEGNVPSVLLKLGTDKQLFINIKVFSKKGEDTEEKEFVTFVAIPKRYQVEPTIQEN